LAYESINVLYKLSEHQTKFGIMPILIYLAAISSVRGAFAFHKYNTQEQDGKPITPESNTGVATTGTQNIHTSQNFSDLKGIAMFVPDRLKANAFRVLRLPSKASLSDVHRAAGDMRRAVMLGTITTNSGDVPVLGELPNSEIDIRAAVGRIENPERRLIDRMFWFHSDKASLVEKKTFIQHDSLQLEIASPLVERFKALCKGLRAEFEQKIVRKEDVGQQNRASCAAELARFRADVLPEAGIETQTLQRHLARGGQQDDGQKRLYVVDESSMASTKQIHTFVERLRENDRVLFVGDVRQHEAVEAGRPYAQLQEAGMRTARLDEIIRQKDPVLKEAVEQLARGEVREAIGNLNSQGRVHEIGDRQERISEIAREYVRSPERTLVVSPDNASRREINEAIHRTMQSEGKVSNNEQRVHVLYVRQDVTGADRQHAQNYERGDVLRYSKGSKPLGIEPGKYARVSHVDRESNTLTVKRNGGEELSYDPRRLQGLTVYRDSERKFAQGDRVQLTAPYHEQKLANRELATIERIEGDGNLKLRTDSGREVVFNARQHPHLDYGYAVTSHSSQGQTADRVLIHVDTEQAPGELVNSRMAYVSVSRAQFDVQMYTNDAKALGYELSRDVSHPTAIQQEPITTQKIEPQSVGMENSQGLSVG
jgi:ATP-dependent exoDNAse (exonuclease V) alpha subunit